MKAFVVAAMFGGAALIYTAEPHEVSALDYNGVRALVEAMISGLKS